MPAIVAEFYGAPLGNRLRNRRLERVAAAVSLMPGNSFPRMFSTDADLEGFYRFLGRDGYSPSDIMEPHVQRTYERIAAERTAIVAHDTSEFEFSGEVERDGLGRLRGNDQGFLGHFSLAISVDSRRPLGVLAMRTWARTGPVRSRKNGRRRNGGDYAKDTEKESTRWREAVEEVEARTDASLIHVMDREADAYPLLVRMAEASRRFVVRLARDRAVGAETVVGERDRISDVLTCAPRYAVREVPISRRKAESAPGSRRFAARQGRIARLSIRAMPLAIQRPNYSGASLPKWLPLHVVHVVEEKAPEGEKPIDWMLLTTEPIETEADVLAVIDYYRARWVIEEYFKTLKVGCAVEKRQLESYESLCRALAIFVPIAWKLLELRTVTRTTPDRPATDVLSRVQIDVLRHCGPAKLPPHPTVRDALLAVAKLGGHIKNNGEPGWQVIGRGFEQLLTLEAGWAAAVDAATKARKGDQS